MSRHCAVGVCSSHEHCAEIGRCFSATPAAPQQDAIDAARYRWLRDKYSVTIDTMLHGNDCRTRSADELDAAIDAAMIKTPNVELTGSGQVHRPESE